MRKYWIKIVFGMLVIFAVGFGVMSAARGVGRKIHSNRDLEIPLGPFIGFNLDGTKLGSIRALTIKRSAPKLIEGFNLRVRLTDSSGFARLENCHVSVNDAQRIDERTHFVCLLSDSGYVSFGEVRAELRNNDGMRTLVLPLLLPPSAVADIQNAGSNPDAPDLADSVAAEVRDRVKLQSRAYRDSVRAVEAESSSVKYKRRADSLREASKGASIPPPLQPKPPTP